MADNDQHNMRSENAAGPEPACRNKKSADNEADEIISLLETESDRGAVLIGLTLLDSEIENLLSVKLEIASAGYIESLDLEEYEGDLVNLLAHQGRVRRNLLKYPGALSSVAAKLDLAFCMGCLSEDSYHDLAQIRKLRNKAAHSTDPVDLFGDANTRKLLTSLRIVSDDHARRAMSNSVSYRAAFTWVIAGLYIRILDATEREYTIAKEVYARNQSKAQAIVENLDKIIKTIHVRRRSPEEIRNTALDSKRSTRRVDPN